jgi:hypothetical protein
VLRQLLTYSLSFGQFLNTRALNSTGAAKVSQQRSPSSWTYARYPFEQAFLTFFAPSLPMRRDSKSVALITDMLDQVQPRIVR